MAILVAKPEYAAWDACPRCAHPRSWAVRRGKRKCAACLYEWRSHTLPLRLSVAQWRQVLHAFLRGANAKTVAEQTGIERKRVLRALRLARQAMAHDLPDHALESAPGSNGGYFQLPPLLRPADARFRTYAPGTAPQAAARQRVRDSESPRSWAYRVECAWRHRHAGMSVEQQAARLIRQLRSS